MVVKTRPSGFLTSVRLFYQVGKCSRNEGCCLSKFVHPGPGCPTPHDLVSQSCHTGRNRTRVTARRGRLTPLTEGASLARRQGHFVTFVPIAWLDERYFFVAGDSCSVHLASYPT